METTQKYKIRTQNTGTTKKEISFEVPQDEVIAETEMIYAELQKDAKLPGFRPGKMPLDLVKKHFQDIAREKTPSGLISKILYPHIEHDNIKYITPFTIKEMNFDFNKAFTCTVILEFTPPFKAKNYKGLKLRKEIKKITDKDIELALEELRKSNAILTESKSGIANANSYVVIDYTVWSNGNELTALKAVNQMVDLSQKHILPGLVEGLLGSRVNENREIKTVLPDNYPDDRYAKKPIVIKTKIKEIKEKAMPELNDEFARDMSCKDIAELREKIKQSLEKYASETAEKLFEQQVASELLKANPVELPESLVNDEEERLVEETVKRLKSRGAGADAIEKQKEAIRKSAQSEAKESLKLMSILNSIAEQENITVEESEIKQTAENLLKANPDLKATPGKKEDALVRQLISHIKIGKILKFILDNSKTTTKEVSR
ncbi:MAG: trigger factor [Elusimicrobiota bacterium]